MAGDVIGALGLKPRPASPGRSLQVGGGLAPTVGCLDKFVLIQFFTWWRSLDMSYLGEAVMWAEGASSSQVSGSLIPVL